MLNTIINTHFLRTIEIGQSDPILNVEPRILQNLSKVSEYVFYFNVVGAIYETMRLFFNDYFQLKSTYIF